MQYPVAKSLGDHDRNQYHDLFITLLSNFIDEGDDWLYHRREVSVQDAQWGSRVPLRPSSLQFFTSLILFSSLVHHYRDSDDFLAHRQRFGKGMFGQTRHAGHGNNHQRAPADGLCRDAPHSEFRSSPLVIRMDPYEKENEGRDGQDDDPCPLGKLRDQKHQGCQASHHCTEAIHNGAVVPTRWSFPPPVHNQSGLGECESREYANGEERNHRIGVPADRDQEPGGEARKHPNAVAKDLSIAAKGEQMG